MSKVLDISKFTEVDPNGHITPNYTGVSSTGLTRSESAYLYSDYGVGYFSSGFNFRFATSQTAGTPPVGKAMWFCPILLTNAIGSEDALSDYIGLEWSRNSTNTTSTSWIVEMVSGTGYSASGALTQGTVYYATLIRDEQVGASGTAYLYLYANAGRTSLSVTISLALHSKADFRYLYAVNTCNDASGGTIGGTSTDITLTKFEDLSTYTEVDPNSRITVSGDSVTGTNLQRDEEAYVLKDKGVNYFSGNYVIELDVKNTNVDAAGYSLFGCLSNLAATFGTIDTANGDMILGLASPSQWYIDELDGGTLYIGTSVTVSSGTQYYCRIIRDESASTYGTAYLYVYSNASRTTLVGTASIALHSSKKDYRYFHALSGANDGTTNRQTTIVQNLAIIENHRYEDFTTYTETDPNSRMVVTANAVTATSIKRNETAIIYKDKGANHFDSHFYHEFDSNQSASAPAGGQSIWAVPWMMANAVTSENADGLLGVEVVRNPGNTASAFYAVEHQGASVYASAGQTITQNTRYFYRVVRDETIGTYGQLAVSAYSNSARTTLVGTQTISLHAKDDFRYIYSMATYNDANANGTITINSQNLDLNEEGIVRLGGYPIIRRLQRMRRAA